MLLEFITVLRNRGRNITSGKLMVGVDNRKVHNRISCDVIKASKCTQDAGMEIEQIRQIS